MSKEDSHPLVVSTTTVVLSTWKPLQHTTHRQLMLDSSSNSCELGLIPRLFVVLYIRFIGYKKTVNKK